MGGGLLLSIDAGRVTRSKEELTALVWEHHDWLMTSAARFDEGHISESKRIAVAIRTLVHHAGKSRSLLRQLGVRDQMQWLSAVPAGETGARSPLWTYDPHEVGFGHLAIAPVHPVDFFTWWNSAVITYDDVPVSRSWMVLNVANFDGGAHVDPNLPAVYKALSRDGALRPYRVNSVGTLYRDTSDFIPSALRTMCSEVVCSIEAALD